MNLVTKGLGRALLVLALLGASASQAAEYLVKYKSNMSMMGLSGMRMQIMDRNDVGQLLKVNLEDKKLAASLAQLLSHPNVEYVVPNFKLRMFTAPADATALKQQWSIAKVQGEQAWAKVGNKGSRKVVVAVIDTGTDYRHKNLAPNMVTGYDFIKNNNDPMDITSSSNPGHGTHCAGVIGATGVVDGGIIGMSPEVSIMPLRFLDENGSGDLNNGVKAIDYAIEKKVDVISASWGAAVPRSQAIPLIEAVQRAEKAGITFVVAASNDGKNNDSYEVYPANAGVSNMISVAASNSNDGKPSWSNYGRGKVHIASPGDTIMSTLPKDTYGNLSGTSMATPMVAGLVALVKAQDPSLTPQQIRALLQSSADKVNIQTACDCRINANGAVDTILGKKMFVAPNAGTFAVGEKVQFEGVYGQGPFTFSSSNTTAGNIDAQGQFTAAAEGETQITVKDNNGQTATSYKIYVGKASGGTDPGNPGGPTDPGNPGDPGDGSCPLGDPMICQIICQIQPSLPFCQQP